MRQRTDGAEIRRIRISKDLTVEDLAVRAGTSGSVIRSIETGATTAPRRNTTEAIARALGVKASAITLTNDVAV